MTKVKISSDDIQNWMLNRLAKELKINKTAIGIDKPFSEFGLGSIQYVSLSGDLEKWLGKSLSPSLLFEHENIRQLTLALTGSSPKTIPHAKKIRCRSKCDRASNSVCNFNCFPEIKSLLKYKDHVENIAGIQLYFLKNEGIANNITHIQGKKYLNFSSYNYLGLAGHAEIIKQTVKAVRLYGTSASASRLVGGEKPLHGELENAISTLLGTEDCIVFNSGHATNVTTLGHMMKKADLILMDKLSHNSLVQGALLSGATIKFFQHNDAHSLETLLRDSRSAHDRALIVTEGVFSMDGDIPPLPEFVKLKNKYQALLYVDEAHSLGVLGRSGQGIREHFQLKANAIDFWMGTLSKALGSCGGYIAGQKKLVNYLRFSAPGFVYSCGISPADTAAALAALQQLQADPSPVITLQKRSRFFLDLLKSTDINTGKSANTAVVPVIIGDSDKTIQLCASLRKQNIYAQALFYPVVEEGASRLRFFINSTHTEKQLIYTAQILTNTMKKLKLL